MGSIPHMLDPNSWFSAVASGWNEMGETAFWVALLKIMWINILLSGDNAVVIAMACRGLPRRQRLWGMVLSASIAYALAFLSRVSSAASLMLLPYLKLAGGLALFYIAAKLLVPDDPDEDEVGGHRAPLARGAHRRGRRYHHEPR